MIYRDAPVSLCPRCGDVLERILDDVASCARCEGVWLEHRALHRAFGTAQFPIGPSAWWKRELECPTCNTVMAPVLVGDLIVDRCSDHGVWMDQGELGRFLGAPSVVELEELHRRMNPEADVPAALVARREARKVELERQQRELEAFRERLAAEQRRLAEEKVAQDRRETEARREDARRKLRALRDEIEHEVADKQAALVALRGEVRDAEAALDHARARLVEIDRQLADV